MKKKAICYMLGVVLAMASLAGCGQKETVQKAEATPQTETEQEQNPVETVSEESASEGQETAPVLEGEHVVKIVLPGEAPKDEENVLAAVNEAMAEDGLNIKLETTYFSWDDYQTKINLIPASGEAYDLCWTHVNWISPMVSKKALMQLDDLLAQYGSDLYAKMNEAKWIDATIGGGIYGIPTNKPTAEYNRLVMIRQDLREKYNLPEIKTPEELDNYFRTVHENEPETMIQSVSMMGVLRDENYAAPYGDNGLYPCYIDIGEEPLTVKNYYESETFKKIVDMNRQWYVDGLMVGPDKADNFGQYMDAGLGINRGGEIGRKLEQETSAFRENVEGGAFEEFLLHPEKPVYIYEAASNMLSIFSTSQEPEAAMAFVNWLRSEQENYDLLSYGVEGVNYNLVDGAVSYDGIPEDKMYAALVWVWEDFDFKRFPQGTPEEYVQMLKTWDEGAQLAPTLGFKFDTEPVITQISQIDALSTEYARPALMGYVDYDEFIDEFLSKLEDAGIEEVMAEMQRQLDAFLAEKK